MPQLQNEEEMPPFLNTIGKCIKKYGYFVQDVADEISISRRTLSNYIAGQRAAPRDILEKIAKTLGCEIEELTLQSGYTSRGSEVSETQKEVSSATESDENEVNRREAGKKIASTLGKAFLLTSPDLVGLPLLQRLSRVLEKSSRVDDTALSGLEK